MAQTALDAALALPSGRTIVCEDATGDGELVTIRNPDGAVELTVLLTEAGPVLRVDAAQLRLVSPGTIRAECARFEVEARDEIVQRAGGDLTQAAAGDVSVTAGRTLATTARRTEVTSTRGDVALTANDDVTLKGERVKLN